MASVRQWAAWAEKRIAGVVVGEGLHVALLGVVQGPLTVTYRLRLVHPSPAALRKLLGMGPALAQALSVDAVRVSDTAQGVLAEVPSPRPRTPAAVDLARHSRGLQVAVGLDQWRRPVGVDLHHHPTLLFVGPSRKGKTQAMKSVLYSLARTNHAGRLQFAIFSAKRTDWEAFEDLTACWGVVSDPDETAQALEWAAGDLLQKRARGGAKSPAIVLVLDDLLNLLKRCPEAAGPIGEIASMGGGVGIFQLIGTQDAGSKRGTGGADVEANITARIVYKAASATTAARAAGTGGVGLDQLSGHKGDGLLIVDSTIKRVATAWADDRDIAQLPAGNVTVSPWCDAVLARSEGRSRNGAQNGQNEVEHPRTGQNGPLIPPHDVATVDDVEDKGGDVGQPFLDSTRPPNAQESERLRQLYGQLGSKEKVYFAAWGFKNGKVQKWLTDALEGGAMPSTAGKPAGNSDNIDLSTEEGRRIFEDMQRSGLIRLPDVSGLFVEGD